MKFLVPLLSIVLLCPLRLHAQDAEPAVSDALPIVATTSVKYQPGPEKHSVVSARFKREETGKLAPR